MTLIVKCHGHKWVYKNRLLQLFHTVVLNRFVMLVASFSKGGEWNKQDTAQSGGTAATLITGYVGIG